MFPWDRFTGNSFTRECHFMAFALPEPLYAWDCIFIWTCLIAYSLQNLTSICRAVPCTSRVCRRWKACLGNLRWAHLSRKQSSRWVGHQFILGMFSFFGNQLIECHASWIALLAGQKTGGQELVGGLDCTVHRNFFGSQVNSGTMWPVDGQFIEFCMFKGFLYCS